MKKRSKYKILKDKVWNRFSKYIRLKFADENGYCTCVTCGVKKPWEEMQAGHFIPGRTNSVLFVEEIIHPQCPSCNIFKGGNYVEYTIYMIDMYGRDKVDEFRQLKNQTKKITITELEDMYHEYETKIKELRNVREKSKDW